MLQSFRPPLIEGLVGVANRRERGRNCPLTSPRRHARQGAGGFSGVKEAIERAGATLRYLPAYSPDLNPIEQAFAKL
jgi:transposase